MQQRETTIPFSGFYESVHSSAIDDAYESLITDENGEPYEDLKDELYLYANSDPYVPYAKAYAKAFNDWFEAEFELGITMTFKEMSSPHEYNFVTDRLFCTLPEADVVKLCRYCDNQALRKLVKETFTSHDGFRSFYDNDLDEWGTCDTWDHNQVGTLIESFIGSYDNFIETETYMLDSDVAYDAVDETLNSALTKLAAKAEARREHERQRVANEARQMQLPNTWEV